MEERIRQHGRKKGRKGKEEGGREKGKEGERTDGHGKNVSLPSVVD